MQSEALRLAIEAMRQRHAEMAAAMTKGDAEEIHEAQLAYWAAKTEVTRLEKEQ